MLQLILTTMLLVVATSAKSATELDNARLRKTNSALLEALKAVTSSKETQVGGVPLCSAQTSGLGIDFCNDWCNVEGLWGCGSPTLSGNDRRNPGKSDYTCDCYGCNKCGDNGYIANECKTGYSSNWQKEHSAPRSLWTNALVAEVNASSKRDCETQCFNQVYAAVQSNVLRRYDVWQFDLWGYNFGPNGMCRCYGKSQVQEEFGRLATDDNRWTFCMMTNINGYDPSISSQWGR